MADDRIKRVRARVSQAQATRGKAAEKAKAVDLMETLRRGFKRVDPMDSPGTSGTVTGGTRA